MFFPPPEEVIEKARKAQRILAEHHEDHHARSVRNLIELFFRTRAQVTDAQRALKAALPKQPPKRIRKKHYEPQD